MVTVRLYMKHNDCASVEIVDNTGKTLYQRDGYMPYELNDSLGGDDTELLIENETGRIIGWQPCNLPENNDGTDD